MLLCAYGSLPDSKSSSSARQDPKSLGTRGTEWAPGAAPCPDTAIPCSRVQPGGDVGAHGRLAGSLQR